MANKIYSTLNEGASTTEIIDALNLLIKQNNLRQGYRTGGNKIAPRRRSHQAITFRDTRFRRKMQKSARTTEEDIAGINEEVFIADPEIVNFSEGRNIFSTNNDINSLSYAEEINTLIKATSKDKDKTIAPIVIDMIEVENINSLDNIAAVALEAKAWGSYVFVNNQVVVEDQTVRISIDNGSDLVKIDYGSWFGLIHPMMKLQIDSTEYDIDSVISGEVLKLASAVIENTASDKLAYLVPKLSGLSGYFFIDASGNAYEISSATDSIIVLKNWDENLAQKGEFGIISPQDHLKDDNSEAILEPI